MKTGSRYTSNYDFGFVTLDIAGCQAEDAGLLVCKATNKKGSAQTSGTLKVKSEWTPNQRCPILFGLCNTFLLYDIKLM